MRLSCSVYILNSGWLFQVKVVNLTFNFEALGISSGCGHTRRLQQILTVNRRRIFTFFFSHGICYRWRYWAMCKYMMFRFLVAAQFEFFLACDSSKCWVFNISAYNNIVCRSVIVGCDSKTYNYNMIWKSGMLFMPYHDCAKTYEAKKKYCTACLVRMGLISHNAHKIHSHVRCMFRSWHHPNKSHADGQTALDSAHTQHVREKETKNMVGSYSPVLFSCLHPKRKWRLVISVSSITMNGNFYLCEYERVSEWCACARASSANMTCRL